MKHSQLVPTNHQLYRGFLWIPMIFRFLWFFLWFFYGFFYGFLWVTTTKLLRILPALGIHPWIGRRNHRFFATSRKVHCFEVSPALPEAPCGLMVSGEGFRPWLLNGSVTGQLLVHDAKCWFVQKTC